MGADLYITKLIPTNKDDKYRDGDHYFRDSYNSSDLLWQYGLSWWNDIKTDLTPDRAKALLKKIKSRRKEFLNNMVALIMKDNKVFDYEVKWDGDKEVTNYNPRLSDQDRIEWVRYFVKKDIEFIKFLSKAIELDSNIECSL